MTIPLTDALVTDVVGGLAIMGAQLILHYWYGKFLYWLVKPIFLSMILEFS